MKLVGLLVGLTLLQAAQPAPSVLQYMLQVASSLKDKLLLTDARNRLETGVELLFNFTYDESLTLANTVTILNCSRGSACVIHSPPRNVRARWFRNGHELTNRWSFRLNQSVPGVEDRVRLTHDQGLVLDPVIKDEDANAVYVGLFLTSSEDFAYFDYSVRVVRIQSARPLDGPILNVSNINGTTLETCFINITCQLDDLILEETYNVYNRTRTVVRNGSGSPTGRIWTAGHSDVSVNCYYGNVLGHVVTTFHRIMELCDTEYTGPTSPPAEMPAWFLPVLTIEIVLGVFIIGFLFWLNRRSDLPPHLQIYARFAYLKWGLNRLRTPKVYRV
ncbi:membrane protein ORF93 [Anguillid herpesvirus 1]|uniref:Membrane protein ORF93 n=1 Tax=Anguillid herpesvirus 1 TaxID=150286 RepID=A0A1J0REE7_9VIRU|nr:membrane protein ORF93 [Anguillid herpesvirus 1]QRM16516.1 membrane protein ORF93 [Anguillid herpesvirus 1]QRM16780.1 membrane protein ORF93 [Anguillid herpesvirus 1]QRM16910.1 membrane protein ORF93 [Anguillid herpesvirus 1]QRM17041.1 membrane protein ORF93 [Anguillid herpesvirus 1]